MYICICIYRYRYKYRWVNPKLPPSALQYSGFDGVLAFTRYCHHQYGTVYAIQKRGRW